MPRASSWPFAATLVALGLAACTPPPAPPATRPPSIVVAPHAPSGGTSPARDDGATWRGEGERALGEVAPLQLFVMSHCPYAVQVENNLREVLAALGPRAQLAIDYIGNVSPNGELTSMHGASEVTDDLVQVCAQRHSPHFFELVLCQNRDLKNGDWRPCAAEAGIPAGPLRTCAEGAEGRQLLAASFERARERQATGSPTMYFGGERYAGSRRPRDLLKAICRTYRTDPPDACHDIPPPPPVNVAVLSDRRCGDCDATRLLTQLQSRIEAPVVRELDYADPEGRALFAAVGPLTLPAFVFDDSLDSDPEAKASLMRGMRVVGGHRVLSTGGSWDPRCADPGGCGRAECKDTLQCRSETPKKLELFVMSHCPFAAKAVASMTDVFQAFGDTTLDFSLQFIGSNDPQRGLTSMHGQSEVDDDVREVCAIKQYPSRHKFMDFVSCRAANYQDPAWEACTGGSTGIDEKRLARCADGPEGVTLLERSFAVSDKLGITASPTWIVNGTHKFSGLDFETIRRNVCKYNPQLKPCAASPSAPVPPPGPTGPGPSCGPSTGPSPAPSPVPTAPNSCGTP